MLSYNLAYNNCVHLYRLPLLDDGIEARHFSPRHFSASIERNIGVAEGALMISDKTYCFVHTNANTRDRETHPRWNRLGASKLGINLHAIKWLIYRWRWIGKKEGNYVEESFLMLDSS